MWPYETRAWAKLSVQYLAAHPGCEFHGCDKPAKHCDHIETVKSDPHRAFDPTNLQALCQPHHNIVTRAYDLGSIRGACDVDGVPVDPSHPWGQATNAAAIEAANSQAAPSGRLAAQLKRAAVQGRPPPSTGSGHPDPHRSNRASGAATGSTARADPPTGSIEMRAPTGSTGESDPLPIQKRGLWVICNCRTCFGIRSGTIKVAKRLDALMKGYAMGSLTPREAEVFDRLMRGKRNKQIAYDLGVTERTVKAHRRSIMEKLGVRTLVEAALIAERSGLING